MNKLKKLSVLAFAAFSLIVSSCQTSVDETPSDEGMKLDKDIAYISISVEKASTDLVSRTVVPKLSTETDFDGFEKLVLHGEMKNSDYEINLSWITEGNETAYDQMKGAIIPLPTLKNPYINDGDVDIWDFELTGYFAGTYEDGEYKEDGTVFYNKIVSKELTKGNENKIVFFLERTTTWQYAGSAQGSVSFDLNFADETVKKVSATYEGPIEEGSMPPVSTPEIFNVTSKKATVSFENLNAGKYIIKMTYLGANDVKVGTRKEYAYVLPSLTSGLAEESTTINVNAVYSITYKNGTEDFAETPFASTVPEKFSRQTKVTLPKVTDFNDTFKDVYDFFGWYTESDFAESSKLVTIEENTIVNDLTLYGKFINVNEKPTFTGFDFKCDDTEAPSYATLKVGHTITAMPMAGENEFLGTIEDLKWYVQADNGGWEEISEGITTTDENPATDATPLKSTLVIKPAYAQKKLKVVARQKYSVTGPNESGIFDIALNETTKETQTSTAVAKGSLAVGTVAVKYTVITVRGEALTNNFEISSGSLIDAKSTSWTYDKNAVTSVVYNSSRSAPSESSQTVENIPIIFSVPGYDEFQTYMSAFINVKYAVPTAESTVPAAVPALHRLPYEVTYNKMKFDSASEVVQYKVGSGSWNAITTSEFESGTVQVRYAAVGTKDNAGYICESEPFTLSSENAVGKKVLLKQVAYSGDVKVCGTITAAASPDFTDTPGINWLADEYGSITWNWYADDTCVKTEAGTHSSTNSLTINEALRGSCFGKALKAEAVYTYIADGGSTNVTKNASCGTVGTGSLEGGAFTYNGQVAVVVGADLSPSKLSVGGITNSLGEDVIISTSNCSFVNPTAPSIPGNETVNVSVTGYDAHTVQVYVNVCAAPPAVGESGGGSGGSDALSLSEETDAISLGYARFQHIPDEAFYKWEYRLSGESSEENENWHAVSPYEFVAPSLLENINGGGEVFAVFIREKLSGVIGETRYYYDFGTGLWRDQASGGMIFEQVEFVNDGNVKNAIVKDLDGTEYTVEQIVEASGEAYLLFDGITNGGIRSILGLDITVSHIDMQLNSSKSNGKVTITPKSGYTVLDWKIDNLSVAKFNALETVSGNAVTSSVGENASLVLSLDGLNEGTYQVTAYATAENGIIYNASASIVVSK